MPHFSIIITVCESDHKHLPHCIQSLMNQTYKEFEVIVMVDGHSLTYDPHQIVCHIPWTSGRVFFTDKSNTCGFKQRHDAIGHARGEYLIWLNADNLVYPTFVQSHKDNIVCAIANDSTPPISIVNIHYWLKENYWGVLPSELSCGNFDLLNYCLPKDVAKQVDAFSRYDQHGGEEDWHTFDRARKIAPVLWMKETAPVACHF